MRWKFPESAKKQATPTASALDMPELAPADEAGRDTVISPKEGVVSPKQGAVSPVQGVTSPQDGILLSPSPKQNGVLSPKPEVTDVASSRQGQDIEVGGATPKQEE